MKQDGKRKVGQLIRLAEEQGWTYLGKIGSHHKLENPAGERIPLPCTPMSDKHTLESIKSRLRRHGLIIRRK